MRPCSTKNDWEGRHELTFSLELHRAECEFLTGEMAAAEQRLTCAFNSRREYGGTSAAVTCCAHRSVHDPGSERRAPLRWVCEYLRRFERPLVAASDRRGAYGRNTIGCGRSSGSGSIEELLDLPLMSDPAVPRDDGCAHQDADSPALYTDGESVSPRHLSDGGQSQPRARQQRRLVPSPTCGLARSLGARFGDYRAGFRFGQARL